MTIHENAPIRIEGKPIKMSKTYPFRIAWISDIHVGAVFGLFPRRWVDHHGIIKMPNEGQLTLLEYLDDFAEICREHKINILAMPGDLITGANRIEGGKYVLSIELPDQKRICASLIADFCKKVGTIDQIWIWKGTGYHGSRDTSVEEDICNLLKAEHGIDTRFMGEYSWLNLHYNGIEKTLFITHPASNAPMYPETAMGRDMMKFQEAYAQKKIPLVDVIVRAHKHSYIEVHKPSIRSIQLPCWQFFVPYDSAMKNYPMWQPDIGGVITLFDDKLRMISWHFTYPNIINAKHIIDAVVGKSNMDLISVSNGRPPCPRCGATWIISRGHEWHCKECNKYFVKQRA